MFWTLVMIILGNYKKNYDIATKTAQWALTPKQLSLVWKSKITWKLFICWILPWFNAYYWTNACFLLNFHHLELNSIVAFSAKYAKISSNYLKMSAFSSRNVQYPRYQDTAFLQLWEKSIIMYPDQEKSIIVYPDLIMRTQSCNCIS